MRLLLDTQIVLWALTGSARLGAAAHDLIADPANEIYVSAASIWEIAIKHALGRGDMPVSGTRAAELCAEAGFRELPVAWRHTALVDTLPPIHADPFDRILVAQASAEPMRLLSRDATVVSYGAMAMAV
ncbi:MAG: type II toxin-antitoxin system VapC family toxin [Candidatus Nitricoxidivorans perseverans]|uniref:Type II toxin-antitoxin system VapC family toxin n=1 Tax=Candidatus Nitricoxidivorans perseverans TaxID=2975601 RepID=A0AA49FME1_9PROT|nr:MAG: type II toxin-antitoxin system VapC family toxin [Candidatus Nitricoxidivorans perseverans]